MCFCCCTTRKSILIYLIVVTSFAFIYGIIAIAEFGSKTDIYDYLIDRLDYLEDQGSSSRRMQYNPYNPYNPYSHSNYEYAKSILDTASVAEIDALTYDVIKGKSYG